MKPTAPRFSHDHALSEMVSITLIVILVIALAAVVASIMFGVIVLYPKSAYVVVQADAKNVSADNWYISVYDSAGDVVRLNRSTATEGLPVDFQLTPPSGGIQYPAADGPVTWKPGETLFIYYQGGLKVTTDEALAKTGSGLQPKGVWKFDIVDGTDNVLVYTKNIGVGVATPTVEPTTPPAPTFTSISPTSGSVAGGTAVTITGTNLFGATAVTFGGTPATSFTVVSGTSITATAPGHSSGSVTVVVTTPNGTATGTNAYTYNAPTAPTFTGITPASGPVTGGTAVTITGTNLYGATAVTFGGTPATSFSVVSGTSITATTPSHTSGVVTVVVTTPNGTATGTNAYTYNAPPAPTFTGITPASGPVTGGTEVTITGTNLFGATAVTFGGTPASSFSVVSGTSITATAPAHTTGTVTIAVTTPNGTATGTNAYTYNAAPAPTFTGIAPATGPVAGGTSVTITGTNFVSGGSFGVTIGGTAATGVVRNSATQITVVTPAGTVGAKNVVITNNDGQTATGTGVFTYYSAAPTLTVISPGSANRGWPVSLTLTGTGFQAGASVRMDRSGGSTLTAYNIVVVSPTQITCTFNLLGVTVDNNWLIRVTNPDGQVSGSRQFPVLSPRPTIGAVSPGTGARGTTITITSLGGTGFQPGATVVYRRSSTTLTLTNVNVLSPTQITGTLVIPSGASTGLYDVTVTNTDGQTRTGTNKLTVT
jgi:hypothetical protein